MTEPSSAVSSKETDATIESAAKDEPPSQDNGKPAALADMRDAADDNKTGGRPEGNDEKNDEDDDEEEEEEEEEDEDEGEDEDDEDDEEDEEPRLKYARLTQHLAPVYRNADATSAFIVAGDKMIVGTHNGNIHVIQLPVFQSLRVYHAHSASVTSISMSPYPPPLPSSKEQAASLLVPPATASPQKPSSRHSDATSSPAAASRRAREPPQVPNTPSNNIYIATSSMDGNVCIQSLVDMKDVQLRNFARPIQAVALSPDYKNDRTYLSGGLAGNLVLTVGGQPGRSTSTTTGTAAAAASGWLGSMGIGTSSGKDTILHSGEGTISTIKWSLSGKYVAWVNEYGIWIMRTKLHLESHETDFAWKRIGHQDRPHTGDWDTMASVWKGRAEWIDEQAVETGEIPESSEPLALTPAAEKLKQQAASSSKRIERLLVGWGSSIWIINVHPGGIGVGKNVGEKTIGRAEVAKLLRMDCIISGISLYTQSLLLVLAYRLPEEEEEEESEEETPQKRTHRGHQSKPSNASTSSEPSGGIKRPANHLPPELRLIDLTSQVEIYQEGLSLSRYERLNSGDYHLGILPAQTAASAVASTKGALDTIAGISADVWNAAINPMALFSSAASVVSKNSGEETASSSRFPNVGGTSRFGYSKPTQTIHPNLVKPGIKIFIHSPYDCILATKTDLGDHLNWLLERQQYQLAWELLNEHPEILAVPTETSNEGIPRTPDRKPSNDVFSDDASSTAFESGPKSMYSQVEKEKRRIGELWIQQLIKENEWVQAGETCGKVLRTAEQWQEWVYAFAKAKKFDEIAQYIPVEPMMPPIDSSAYEVVLAYYMETDKLRFKDLVERWPTDLYNVTAVTTDLENQLKFRNVREDSVEDGEKGRDWRIVMESLAKLHEANGRHREALRCYIRLQDANSAFRLIRDSHLTDAVADDIPSFIGLRVPDDEVDHMNRKELEAATSEAIALLVDEAQHGLVRPSVVVSQLREKDLNLYIYFYLRGLWKGEGLKEHTGESADRLRMETQSLVDEYADLTVRLFAMFDRPLLMDFLKTSTSYAFEKAVQECERYSYDDELVYLYAKTGQMKRALYLIIDRLRDVKKAIDFAKEQDDPDLWEDLLTYSMDKPSFIRGLLEQVGTAINPITLVKRIPEGLQIEGLREGLKHIMKEQEIQHSISDGVARVLRSEVAAAQAELRNGQRKGIKFDVVHKSKVHVDVEVKDLPTAPANPAKPSELDEHDAPAQPPQASVLEPEHSHKVPEPGHCAQCHAAFTEFETDTLVGFACGHVFHLAHLLQALYPGQQLDMDFGGGQDFESRPRGYRIGTKVTHARLLRDRIRGGCPVCHKKEGDGSIQ